MTHGNYVNLKDSYYVIADGFIKHHGNFRSCQKYCRDITWAHDAFTELIIVKVVANGKEV